MAKKAKKPAKEGQKTKRKPRKRRWVLRVFLIALLGVLGAAVFFPKTAVRYIVSSSLEAMGLVPAQFTVVDVGLNELVIADISLGAEADLTLKELHAEYTLIGLWRGRVDSLDLTQPVLIGKMVGDISQGISFGVLDKWMFDDTGESGATPALPQTVVTVTDGLARLQSADRPILDLHVEGKVAVKGTSGVSLEVRAPETKTVLGTADFTHDANGGLHILGALDIPNLALFNWDVQGVKASFNFAGKVGEASGTAGFDIAHLSLDSKWLEQVLTTLPDSLKIAQKGPSLRALLQEGLGATHVSGVLDITQETDHYTARLNSPLTVLGLNKKTSLHLALSNGDIAKPAFTFVPNDKNRLEMDLSFALDLGETPDEGFHLFSHVEAASWIGEAPRRFMLRSASIETTPVFGNDLSVALMPLEINGEGQRDQFSGLFKGNVLLNGALIEGISVKNNIIALNGTYDLSGGASASLKGDLTSEDMTLSVFETALRGALPPISLKANYTIGEDVWSAAFKTQGGGLLMESGLARLSDIVVNGTASGRGASLQDFDADIESITVTNPDDLPLFAPLIVKGTVNTENRVAALLGNVRQGADLDVLTADGSHDWASGFGSLNLQSGDIQFVPKGLQPEHLAPPLGGMMVDATGLASFSGALSWSPDKPVHSGGTITLSDINFASAVGPVSGVSAQIKLDSLLPLTTAHPQIIDIQMIDLGLELAFGYIKFSFSPDGRIFLDDAKWPWAGGDLGLERAELVFDGTPQELSLFARNVNLTEVFTLLDVDGLSGNGRMQGTLPVVMEHGGATINQGLLSAIEPGGTIQYIGVASAAGETSEGSNLLFEALEDFSYDTLDVEINGQTTDILKVAIKLKGRNAALLQGYPINLNISTEGPLVEMLRKGTAGYRLPTAIKQSIE